MNLLEILKTIQEDWIIIVFVFGLGGAWWQGKTWFKSVNDTLSEVGLQHKEQNKVLENILIKTESLEDRTDKIEQTVNQIHDKVHNQEVKLAVLESVTERKSRRTLK
jgi:hypothetical protein